MGVSGGTETAVTRTPQSYVFRFALSGAHGGEPQDLGPSQTCVDDAGGKDHRGRLTPHLVTGDGIPRMPKLQGWQEHPSRELACNGLVLSPLPWTALRGPLLFIDVIKTFISFYKGPI